MLGGFFMPKKVGRPRKSTTTTTDTRVGENGRSKVWTFVVYPESIDKNWKAILDEEHIQWIESPLHDKDVNADGTAKKAHIHVMVLFSSVKTYEQVADLTAQIGATIPQSIPPSPPPPLWPGCPGRSSPSGSRRGRRSRPVPVPLRGP